MFSKCWLCESVYVIDPYTATGSMVFIMLPVLNYTDVGEHQLVKCLFVSTVVFVSLFFKAYAKAAPFSKFETRNSRPGRCRFLWLLMKRLLHGGRD